MIPLSCEHLVIGAGYFGLAIADHLLRRGADGVVVVEKRRVPGAVRDPGLGLAISSGRASDAEDEQRARDLLEDWPSYLEVDPKYRRSGALVMGGSGDALGHGFESLDATRGLGRPGSGLVRPERIVGFSPGDGVLQAAELGSALQWQVRKKGGRVLTETEIQSIGLDGDGVAFDGTRTGTAGRVYIATGDDASAFATDLGHEPRSVGRSWVRVELRTQPSGDFAMVRLPMPRVEVEGSDILELDDAEPDAAESDESALWIDDGCGHAVLSFTTDLEFGRTAANVDWEQVERVREQVRRDCPAAADAEIVRASAEEIRVPRWSDARGFEAAEGRILGAGAFGHAGLLRALGAAERIVESALEGH